MVNYKAVCAVFALLFGTVVLGANGGLKEDPPQRYTVKPGDTLWDISGRFLTDPWYWPEIWYRNPDIDNPHLIYPGDVIKLTMVDGEPRLTVDRGGGTVKLSPEVRTTDLNTAISTIPVNAIRPFISGHRVVSQDVYDAAPYIVASDDEQIPSANSDRVFVRNLQGRETTSWDVIRKGEPLIDPETGDRLGFEATRLGAAELVADGDPSTFLITDSNLEIRAGARLLETENRQLRSRFTPRAPEQDIEGTLMAVMEGVSQVAQYDVVAINRGSSDGLEAGHVLEILKRGRTVTDNHSENTESVTLPNQKAGELIVFRTYEQMSFGLVMDATRAMAINDLVRSP